MSSVGAAFLMIFAAPRAGAAPPASRGEQFLALSVRECEARAESAFKAEGWGSIAVGDRWTSGQKDVHVAYITCNEAGEGRVVVNVFVASERGDGGVPGAQRERLQAQMSGKPASESGPGGAGIEGGWQLSMTCAYYGAAKMVTLKEGPGGALSGAVSDDPKTSFVKTEILADSSSDSWNGNPPPMRSRHSAKETTLVLHPAGWISILQLSGTGDGSRIEGAVHHYGSDDCRFTMTRGGGAFDAAGGWKVTFSHDFGGALAGPKTVTLKETSGGALSGAFEGGELLADSSGDWNGSPPALSSKRDGDNVALVLHVGGWISIIQLSGAWNGSRIEGKFHHYGSDDGTFTMTRQ